MLGQSLETNKYCILRSSETHAISGGIASAVNFHPGIGTRGLGISRSPQRCFNCHLPGNATAFLRVCERSTSTDKTFFLHAQVPTYDLTWAEQSHLELNFSQLPLYLTARFFSFLLLFIFAVPKMAFRTRIQRVATGLAARPCQTGVASQSMPISARMRLYSQAAAVPTTNLGQSSHENIAVSPHPRA